ncbi:MAG: hypothetical protein ACRENK_08350 [Gemmatimonadaceae bacterium]
MTPPAPIRKVPRNYAHGQIVVRVTGFEPALDGLVNRCLCRLGYTRVFINEHGNDKSSLAKPAPPRRTGRYSALCATPRLQFEQLVRVGNLLNSEDLKELEDLVDVAPVRHGQEPRRDPASSRLFPHLPACSLVCPGNPSRCRLMWAGNSPATVTFPIRANTAKVRIDAEGLQG